MIEWYNKDITVCFDRVPNIRMRYCTPSTTKQEKKSIKKYPFINIETLNVKIFYKKENQSFEFTIPKDFCFDGASIPRFFWRIIGSNTDNTFLIAAMVHDYMCLNHSVVNSNRYLSTLIFNDLLEVGGTPAFKRWLMKHSVDNFQKFQKWKAGEVCSK